MYLDMQVGTRKVLENILDPTQSPSMCLTVLDALKVSLLALNKAHKINVVNEPGGTNTQIWKWSTQSRALMEVFPVITMGISIEPGGPDSTKHLGS